MIEIIDRATMQKMMAMIVCGLCYQGDCYLIYCIRRNNEEANVFVSKLIKGSMGYVIDTDFSNGEKEVLDGTINRILNKESREKVIDIVSALLAQANAVSQSNIDSNNDVIDADFVENTSKSIDETDES